MRRKWASCFTAGTLSFNEELVSMPRELGDYVIVHELLHFSVPNHGKLWKSLMRAHLGPYKEKESQLNSISKVTLTAFKKILKADLTNIIEDGGKPMAVESGSVDLNIGHHAIETVKFEVAR